MKTFLLVLGLACLAYGLPAKGRAYGGKIVNGQEVSLGDVPWQVSFQNRAGSQRCGGTLLSESWVMCAAHCVDGSEIISPSSSWIVYAGMVNFDNAVAGTQGQYSKIEATIRANNYNRFTFEHDVSLLKLATPFDLDQQYIGVGQLPQGPHQTGNPDPNYKQGDYTETYPDFPDTSFNDGATAFIVTGYGTTSSGGSISHTLRATAVAYVTDDTCSDPAPPAPPSAGYSGQIADHMICAGGVGGNHDSCQGDSGGPMNEATGEYGNWTLTPNVIGIVSWGSGCAGDGKPGVYTQVSYATDWIKTAMDCYDNGPNAGDAAACGVDWEI